ncbi:MAG: hypothetical protein LBC69_03560 [Eubacteriaceae bacterium]|jgi:UDP-N-acetylmuramyl-tripeptide synthetase|nr:hypothetical protein [Eubacteriaceae bacterium]
MGTTSLYTRIDLGSDQIESALLESGLLVVPSGQSLRFCHISYNSKDIREGTLFICKGERFKEEYLDEAIRNGATCYVSETGFGRDAACLLVSDVRKAMAIIAREAYGYGMDSMTLIAVTGSKGKTTTTRFLFDAICKAACGKAAYTSTTGFFDGTSFGEHPNHNTTMESLDTYRVIRRALDSGVRYMIIEASSQAAKLDRLYGIEFDYGIFTSIDRDHISPNEHRDFSDYLSAKIDIMAQCRAILANRALLLRHPIIAEKLRPRKIYTYGTKDGCDFQAGPVRCEGRGYAFSFRDNLSPDNYAATVAFSLFGEYNALNATAAAAIIRLAGISGADLENGFASTEIEGRSEVFEGFLCPVIVDYAHNRLSADEFYKAVSAKYPNARIIAVFGCPGNKAENRRKDLGQTVGAYASYVYVTTEDPADEEFSDIAGEIIDNLPSEVGRCAIEDREEAIIRALDCAKPEDVITIIGKGDEKSFTRKGVTTPYKGDVQVVSEYLAGRAV